MGGAQLLSFAFANVLIGSQSYFFSASGSSVKIYSVSTGHVVSTLIPTTYPTTSDEALSSSDIVTSIALNPHNPFQLFTTSISGFLRIWDILDGIILRTLDIGQPIHYISVHQKFNDEFFLALTRPRKSVTS